MPFGLGFFAVAGAGAAGGGSFDLLETTLISTNTTSVTFSNLNNYSDYKHLQLRITMRSSASGTSVGAIHLRFNGNTSNYANHYMLGTGSTFFNGSDISASLMTFYDSNPQTSSTTNAFGAVVIDILDFSNASKNKTVRTLHGIHTAGGSRIGLQSGLWANIAAVTSILVGDSSNQFVSGSRFSLYGVK